MDATDPLDVALFWALAAAAGLILAITLFTVLVFLRAIWRNGLHHPFHPTGRHRKDTP